MMTSAFQFRFEGDDIEDDSAEEPPLSTVPEKVGADEELPQNEPKAHSLEDLVCKDFILLFFSSYIQGFFFSRMIFARFFHSLYWAQFNPLFHILTGSLVSKSSFCAQDS